MSARPTADLHREQLPNGVTLLVQRRDAAPAAAIVAHVRAGFLDEPDAVAGISHVLEHMLFKGTPSLGPGELAQRTKALGGSLNAYTSYDRTVYYASVPSRHAYQASALQADQVRNPLFDADELRRELGVIVQEARRKLDTPGAVTGENLHALLYAKHWIRRWRIGEEAVIEAFTREQVADYHRSRYTPNRTIVTMVSDLDTSEALAVLAAQWGDWSLPGSPIDRGPAELRAPWAQASRLEGDVAAADLALGWRGVGPLHPVVPALDVAGAILTSGRSSRLARLLREPGVVAGVSAGHYGTTDADGAMPAGVFAVGAECEPDKLREALRATASTIRDLRASGPSADEIDRAKTLLRMRLQRRLERYEARATALAAAEAQGDVSRLDREDAEIQSVTRDSVREAVQEYLDPATASAVVYVPTGTATDFDEAFLADAMRAPAAPMVPLVHRADAVSAKHAVAATRRRERGVLHCALPGLDLLVARHGDVPQVGVTIYRPRTPVTEFAQAGVDVLGLRTMLRGTTRLDAAELALAFESLGGVLSPALGADVIGFGTTVLQENVTAAARLLREVWQAPRFESAGVKIERELLAEDARAVADDMVQFPFQLALGQAFADVGYGAATYGTPESLAALDASSVRAWHERLAAAGPTTIVAVGSGDPEELADRLLSELGGLAVAGAPNATQESLHPRAGLRHARRERKQAALAMIFPGPSRKDPERYAAEVWAAIAGGLGGRLFESLRSARSLGYSVMASSWQRRCAGGLLTYIAMAPERLEEARTAMLEELDLFRSEPPSAKEVTRATAMLAGQIEVSRQSAGAVAGEIADAWLLGEGLAELEDPAAPYRRIRAEDVHAVAAAFDPEWRAEGVVSPEGTE